jgi:hypothetical protein
MREELRGLGAPSGNNRSQLEEALRRARRRAKRNGLQYVLLGN